MITKPSLEGLHVIAVCSNPVRFKSRYKLFKDFHTRMQDDHGIDPYVVELGYGKRAFEVSQTDHPRHIQLRTTHELWHKENMINIAMQQIAIDNPNYWGVVWIDADIQFINRTWLQETYHQLQHYDFVQCFDTAIDLGPDNETLEVHRGFVWCYDQCLPFGNAYSPFWHPGYCWAARREAIDKLGGLLEHGILGAGDHHMALALIGKAKWSLPGKIHPNYTKMVMDWEENAETYIKRNIGYVKGTILHHYHGPKAARKYVERWDILVKHKYDPTKDVKYDTQGILQLSDQKIGLRDDIRKYFRQRKEDAIVDY